MVQGDGESRKRRWSERTRKDIDNICEQSTESMVVDTPADTEGGEEEEKERKDCVGEEEEEKQRKDQQGHLSEESETEDDDDEDEESYDCGYGVKKLDFEDPIDRVPQIINESRDFGPSLYTDRGFGPWMQTSTLLEVFSIKISGGAGKYLHGKIAAQDVHSLVYLYNKPRSHCAYLGKESEAVITLTGPYRALDVSQCFLIYFDLYVKDSEGSEQEEHVSRGVIAWDLMAITPGVFTDVVPGNCGSAKMTYAIIESGVEAMVGVIIYGGSVKSFPAKVVAGYKLEKKRRVIVLFDGVFVGDGSILLSRSALAVPLKSNPLEIELALEHDEIRYTSSFDPQYYSVVKDEPEAKGKCGALEAKRKYGVVQITVKWSSVRR